MANLLGANIGANYKGFLNLGNTINTPLSGGTALQVTDGMGNGSALNLNLTQVGIGTTTPSETLTVRNSGSRQILLENSAGGIEGITSSIGGNLASFDITVGGKYRYGPLEMFPPTMDITFGGQDIFYGNITSDFIPKKATIGFTDSLIYDNGSNIGIGTSTPSYKLNLYAGNNLYNIGTNNAFAANTNYFIGHGLNDGFTPANITAKIGFVSDAGVGQFSNAITFYTSPTVLSISPLDVSVERMRITNSGNVGIGTSSPTDKLTVEGDIKFGTGTAAVETIRSAAGGNMLSYNPVASVLEIGGGYINVDTANGIVNMQYSPVVIGAALSHPSAKLEVVSTNQGILFPRMTTTQKNAISSPAAGLVIYDTTLNKLCVRAASAWQTITSV